MFLKYRPIRHDDLNECLATLRDRFAYSETDIGSLLKFWRAGIDDNSLHMALMEDVMAPLGSRIYYFIIKGFLRPDVRPAVVAGQFGLLGWKVVKLWAAGKSPLLTFPEIRENNTDGHGDELIVATLHAGGPAFTAPKETFMLWAKIAEWMAYSNSGYRKSEYMVELYNPSEWAWGIGSGLTCMHEYTDPVIDGARVPPHVHPRLYHVTSDKVPAGTTMEVSFQWAPPLFHFSPTEQALLLHALLGDTDEDLAHSLNVALPTVKKRWQNIYGKVEEISPDLFGAIPADVDVSRGKEKKRLLLGYLKFHMQELRPVLPTARNSRK